MMKTAFAINRSTSSIFLAGAAATLAVAAMGFAGTVHARDNVFWSVGVGTPGAVVNVGNVGSIYQPQPVYVQPQPVYVQPQPVYVQPQPVYFQPQPVYSQPAPVYYEQRPQFVRPAPIYVAPQPVYYGRPYGYGYGHGHGHWRHEGRYVEGPRPVYGPGYAPVYQQREGRDGRDGYRY